MALSLIKQILSNDKEILIEGSLVVDQASGKSFSQHAADASIHLTAADVETQIAPLKKTLNDFLTGEDDGGDIDRLTELVKAIGDNKDSIDALTSQNHSHANSAVLDGIGKDGRGDLTFNGKTLDGSTGIAFVGEASETPVFGGKIVYVLEPYAPPSVPAE